MSSVFGTPERIGAAELRRDVAYSKIPPGDHGGLVEFAWDKGERAADDLGERYGWPTPQQLVELLGLSVVTVGRRVPGLYSEYLDGPQRIVLYAQTIAEFADQHAGWLAATGVESVELFLAHEVFHSRECRDPAVGIVFRQRRVVSLRVGPFVVRTGLRALSEIAAHAFTRRYVTGLVTSRGLPAPRWDDVTDGRAAEAAS